MTSFDLILILLVVGIVLFEIRHDAGRALLDAVATLVAAQVSRVLAPALTQALHWQPFPGTQHSPMAQGILFVGCSLIGLAAAGLLHRYTRWSMDQWDPAFAVGFGLVMGITAGHVTTTVVGSHEMMVHRKLPGYYAESLLSEELRSFKSYHYVMETLGTARSGR